MPFISRIVGDYVFHKEANVYKRFLFGAATYLSVKGVITLVRKYKFRRWLRERKVKDFEGTVSQSAVYNRGDSMIFWISWAADPAGQDPCGFDKRWYLGVK